MTRPDPLPHLAAVAQAMRAAEQPEASFAALEAALGAAIGHRLFTVMKHDPARSSNARIYSNQPRAYPVAGRKLVVESGWTEQVVRRGKPWIGRSEADIRWAYADHELLLSLGCESAMNLPVRWQGRTLGAVNLLHGKGWYSDADAALGRIFAALAVPALLAAPLPD